MVYEVHVRAFSDSAGDGVGDLVGLTRKLDYLQDLGITAVWLLPFYPSPLRDDGYDISDYVGVHTDYGTLDNFRDLLREAHRRDIRVITELVLNHTSDQHRWFQRARRAAPESPERQFYLWSDTPDQFSGVRVLFPEVETSNWAWDPVAKAYFYHRFYSHQPDLNYDNPLVRAEMEKVLDFWLGLGVDGFRLDSIPYLFKREGTTCEGLPETHAFLRGLRAHVESKFDDRLLLAEANQWPEEAVAYFGSPAGPECHAAFHFPLMPRLFLAVQMEDRFPVLDILEQTPAIPPEAQWFLFLRNHDELTLTTVSDIERDFLLRSYAHDARMRVHRGIRRRLAPLLSNDRRQIELLNVLLFSLPGTPVIYYGDEIGMGDNIYLGDRNAVRTPMQWSADRNAGFSRSNPQRLYLPIIIDPESHYEAVNVDAQQANPHSLLWFMKRLIALRTRTPVLGRGAVTFLEPTNRAVFAFLREDETDRVLVVANLSRSVQHVALDLSSFRGARPTEMFGDTGFPPIGRDLYPLTLGPNDVFWLRLPATAEATGAEPRAVERTELPSLAVSPSWAALQQPTARSLVERALAEALAGQAWFRDESRSIAHVRWTETMSLGRARADVRLAKLDVEFREGAPETFLLPLGVAAGSEATRIRFEAPTSVLATLHTNGRRPGLLYDATQSSVLARAVLSALDSRTHVRGRSGDLVAEPSWAFASPSTVDPATAEVAPLPVEPVQGSTLIGGRLLLKFLRRVDGSPDPELEVGRFLQGHGGFRQIEPIIGQLEFRRSDGEVATVALVQEHVPYQSDGWTLALEQLRGYFDRARAYLASHHQPPETPSEAQRFRPPPGVAVELIGPYLEIVRLLGTRTGQLHLALAADPADPAFAPEPLDGPSLRSAYQEMRNKEGNALSLLRAVRERLPDLYRPVADAVLAQEDTADRWFRTLLDRHGAGQRIRTHGSYRLDRVHWTGKDVVITGLESDPRRRVSERRIKRSPLHDVTEMLRSFSDAGDRALEETVGRRGVSPAEQANLEPMRHLWETWVTAAFVEAYRTVLRGSPVVPAELEEFRLLLDTFKLERAFLELAKSLEFDPESAERSLRELHELLSRGPPSS